VLPSSWQEVVRATRAAPTAFVRRPPLDTLDTEVESRHEGTLDVPKVISTSSRPVAPLTFKTTARILAGILAVSPKNKGLDGGDRQDPGGTTAAIQRGIIHL
jgi:hypothetical protein